MRGMLRVWADIRCGSCGGLGTDKLSNIEWGQVATDPCHCILIQLHKSEIEDAEMYPSEDYELPEEYVA